ncbi:MAG TPA: L-2-amino-thiazoline-4-carboxylic acid hydrolase [Acetobacteraceae bacterium]|nr:L-2-amino-thiazoline-4-carboxylic acid hydrolase [Acetobacteraceae bacterium]
MDDMPILTRRRIEAEFAAGLYAVLREQLGEAAAKRILADAIIRMARASGAAMAAEAGGGLDGFRAVLPRWTAEDALRIEVLHASDTRFDFDVTRCRYAEMYRAMGLAELGAVLSCNRDGAFCEGFDPSLRLTRTQTIMAGASHCDFRYRLVPPGDAVAAPQATENAAPATPQERPPPRS